MDRSGRRRTVAFRPRCERVEGRQLLSTVPVLNPRMPFLHPLVVQAVGPGALIVGATIAPGAIVGPLARVGPGVVVPAGMFVLPGANVTTSAEASNPALGKVAPITGAQFTDLAKNLANNQSLAAGYA